MQEPSVKIEVILGSNSILESYTTSSGESKASGLVVTPNRILLSDKGEASDFLVIRTKGNWDIS